MKQPQPARRLRLPRIEQKPKKVFAERWADFAGIKARPTLVNELVQIIRRIERGDGVPEEHYRDGLLEDKGIMHLHLGGKDSDVLVFLIQYAGEVVLLETNSHVHFRIQPAGKNILALSQSWLGNLERAAAEAARQAQEAVEDAERQEAEAKRAKLVESVRAFKAKVGLK